MDPDDVEYLAAAIKSAGRQVGDAISGNVAPGQDAAGGTVACLTEATMGITAGLCQIAEAIRDLAEAIRERNVEADE